MRSRVDAINTRTMCEFQEFTRKNLWKARELISSCTIHRVHITPLVIHALRGGHTHTHTHKCFLGK